MRESKGVVSIVPLTNFDSDVDLVQLGNGVCLRRVKGSELEKLIERTPDYRFALENALQDVEYVIEKEITPEAEPSIWNWSEESPYVKNIVLALRLLKEGHVEAPTAFLLSPTTFAVSETTPHVRAAFTPYYLGSEEINSLRELLRKLRDFEKKKPHLKFPLAQFTKAHEETYPEDMLVDLMTAFESLVFHRGKNATRPIGRTIGIAIGMLLGGNERERTKIEELEAAYELRNTIVHGHLRKKFQKYATKHEPDFILKVEFYLRRALRKFLEE